LDPMAYGRKKLFDSRRLGTAFDGGSRPGQEAPANRLPKISWQWRRRVVERLLDPSGDFAIGGVDDLVTEANRVLVECDGSAQNMKAGAGAKLANKPDVEAAGGRAGEITKAQIFRRRYGSCRGFAGWQRWRLCLSAIRGGSSGYSSKTGSRARSGRSAARSPALANPIVNWTRPNSRASWALRCGRVQSLNVAAAAAI